MADASYTVMIHPPAKVDIEALAVFEQRRVTDAIRANLVHEPTKETRNKKVLIGLVAGFHHDLPLRELRVGEVRVFYDVDEPVMTVNVRAVRIKSHGQTTVEITR